MSDINHHQNISTTRFYLDLLLSQQNKSLQNFGWAICCLTCPVKTMYKYVHFGKCKEEQSKLGMLRVKSFFIAGVQYIYIYIS